MLTNAYMFNAFYCCAILGQNEKQAIERMPRYVLCRKKETNATIISHQLTDVMEICAVAAVQNLRILVLISPSVVHRTIYYYPRPSDACLCLGFLQPTVRRIRAAYDKLFGGCRRGCSRRMLYALLQPHPHPSTGFSCFILILALNRKLDLQLTTTVIATTTTATEKLMLRRRSMQDLFSNSREVVIGWGCKDREHSILQQCTALYFNDHRFVINHRPGRVVPIGFLANNDVSRLAMTDTTRG